MDTESATMPSAHVVVSDYRNAGQTCPCVPTGIPAGDITHVAGLDTGYGRSGGGLPGSLR